MAKRVYGKITFPDDGLFITYDQFKKDFGGSEDFNNTPEKDREAAIKKAYGIATKDAVKPEPNGDVSTTTDKSEKVTAEKAGK